MNINKENSNNFVSYKYTFKFTDGIEKEFIANLDNKTLDLIAPQKNFYPKWTELNFFKCSNCPLIKTQHKYCPIAINIVEIIDFFQNYISYEEVDVIIETKARTYLKHTSIQTGLSSLMGIFMVTSGCPILEKLKPMVRFHLPFATIKETRYRVIAMYLLGQHFLYKHGKTPDWNFENLVKIYDDIRVVNRDFCARLSHVEIEDAARNAVIELDCFAEYVIFSINENILNEIELLFKAYLK